MSAHVTVFRRRERSFVQVFARSGRSWREVSAQALPDPLSPAMLGAAVRSALHASAVAKQPGRFRRSPEDGRLPALVGVTSWIGFARGAVGVGVLESDGTVRVCPMRRDGGAYVDLEEHETTLPGSLDAVDDEALGAAVEQCLALAV